MPPSPAPAAALAVLSILACAGVPSLPGPAAFPAEPVALVDLPDEEHPTGLALFANGGFVATVQQLGRSEAGMTTVAGGVRFRGPAGVDGPRADIPPEHNVSADSVAVSPDGARVAVVRYDRVDLVPLDGGEVRSLPLHDALDRTPAGILSHCGSAGQLLWVGGTIAARCATGVPVVLLDVETGARTLPVPRPDVEGPYVTVYDIALTADGGTLAVLGSDDDLAGTVRPWLDLRSTADGALARRIPLDQRYEDVAWSPDGGRLAVSHPYFGLAVLDAADGRVLAAHTYEPDRGDRGSGDVVWAPDGKRLYRVGRRLGVSVHDPADARVLGFLPAHPTEPENPMPPPSDWPATLSARNGSLALTPDGRFLASIERSDYGRAVRVWRVGE